MSEQILKPAIIVENISKSYPTPDGILEVLNDINFRAEQSESIAIVGVSGSGKSTLLALLAGLDLPTSGSISIHGERLSDTDEDARAKLRNKYIGFVFQQFHLLGNLSALENVALPLELRGDKEATQHANTALDQVGLSERVQHFPRQLSGGEQQRVALARAFCARPKILYADEPTGNLDTATATKITDLLFALNEEYATTLVLVTHDETLAARCARQVRLVDGHLIDV
jgi:putative ABC transport system ATP-binding protein